MVLIVWKISSGELVDTSLREEMRGRGRRGEGRREKGEGRKERIPNIPLHEHHCIIFALGHFQSSKNFTIPQQIVAIYLHRLGCRLWTSNVQHCSRGMNFGGRGDAEGSGGQVVWSSSPELLSPQIQLELVFSWFWGVCGGGCI
jgi:hypothetical protein